MLTINLEKKLLKQNKKILLPEELLAIKEYERLGDDFCESEVLNRIGINTIVKRGKSQKRKLDEISNKLAHFDQERVFHQSQIKSLCDKYYLRFLNVEYFKGSVDSELAKRVTNFEIAYNVKCDKYNCRIVAPVSSFKLEEKPKDPLFFFDLGNDYYYLVHKWGNDLSITRRLMTFFTSWVASVLSIILLLVSIIGLSGVKDGPLVIIPLAGITVLVLWHLLAFLLSGGDSDDMPAIRFFKKNDWVSTYI